MEPQIERAGLEIWPGEGFTLFGERRFYLTVAIPHGCVGLAAVPYQVNDTCTVNTYCFIVHFFGDNRMQTVSSWFTCPHCYL